MVLHPPVTDYASAPDPHPRKEADALAGTRTTDTWLYI